jgi:serine/threonine protein kinase
MVHRDVKSGNIMLQLAAGVADPGSRMPAPPTENRVGPGSGGGGDEQQQQQQQQLGRRQARYLPGAVVVAKLGDFGTLRKIRMQDAMQKVTGSGSVATAHMSTEHIVGTCSYMPFEYLYRGMITVKMDAFALGVVIGELITGRAPQDVREIAAAAQYGEMDDSEGSGGGAPGPLGPPSSVVESSLSAVGMGGGGAGVHNLAASFASHSSSHSADDNPEDSSSRQVSVWGLLCARRMQAPGPAPAGAMGGMGTPAGYERNLLGEPWERSGNLERLAWVAQKLLIDDRRARSTVAEMIETLREIAEETQNGRGEAL